MNRLSLPAFNFTNRVKGLPMFAALILTASGAQAGVITQAVCFGKNGISAPCSAGDTLIAAPKFGVTAESTGSTEVTQVDANNNIQHAFNQFNSAVGTLTSVGISLDSAANFLLTAGDKNPFVNFPVPISVGLHSLDSLLQVILPSSLFQLPNQPVLTLVGPETLIGSEAETFQQNSTSKNFIGNALFTNPGDLAGYLGAGQFNAQLKQSLTLKTPETNSTAAGFSDWSGRLVLTYNYRESDTNPIPEPGTISLLGLAALVLAGRRRRAARS